MKITVRLFATLREGRGKEIIIEGVAGMNCTDVIRQLDIQEDEVAILLVNGRDAAWDKPLSENDVVSIFPPVGGG